MAREHYSESVRLKCQQLFIEESKKPREIALIMNGKPSWRTITRWSKIEDWEKSRKEWLHHKIQELSPKSIEEKIMGKISELLDNEIKDNATADALAKYLNSLFKISSQKSQIPAMFSMLEEFLKFIRKNQPDLLTPALIKASRDFKDDQLETHGLNSV
ncbi:MAG: hypothetical protein H8E26_14170 [FCB group bacterium]|nr:hypothetical protein [FCB group bacterium]MBL7027430.1 hypothetical protein [Candidatus Neomarinimicrobiota bacterium]MBL7122588.1 hypothetical protein [Candidatus Neomarinimicrobiota bacterium]